MTTKLNIGSVLILHIYNYQKATDIDKSIFINLKGKIQAYMYKLTLMRFHKFK